MLPGFLLASLAWAGCVDRAVSEGTRVEWSGPPALAPLVDQARVVGLGEATHGTAEFGAERARVTRWLIEERGFEVVALEVSAADIEWARAYVDGADIDPELALARLQTWPYQTSDILALMRWMRSWNDRGGTVRLEGFDVQGPVDQLAGAFRLWNGPDDLGRELEGIQQRIRARGEPGRAMFRVSVPEGAAGEVSTRLQMSPGPGFATLACVPTGTDLLCVLGTVATREVSVDVLEVSVGDEPIWRWDGASVPFDKLWGLNGVRAVDGALVLDARLPDLQAESRRLGEIADQIRSESRSEVDIRVSRLVENAAVSVGTATTRSAGRARDEAMADNVTWLLAHHSAERAVLWAHDEHLARARRSMGVHLDRAFGSAYVPVAFTTSTGSYLANGGGELSAYPLYPPWKQTLEARFDGDVDAELLLFPSPMPCSGRMRIRSIGATPRDSEIWQFLGSPVTAFDAVVHLRHTHAAEVVR